jgi:hypothetical protein
LKIGGCTYFNDCYVIFLQLGEREGGLGLWAEVVLAAFERATCLQAKAGSLQSFLPQRQAIPHINCGTTSIPQLFIGKSSFSFICNRLKREIDEE